MSELIKLRKDWEPPQNNISIALNGALLKLSDVWMLTGPQKQPLDGVVTMDSLETQPQL